MDTVLLALTNESESFLKEYSTPISIISSLIIAIIIFYLNKNKEKKIRISELKNEIAANCDKIIRHTRRSIENKNSHSYYQSMLELPEFKGDDNYISQSLSTLEESNNAITDIDEQISELIKNTANLFELSKKSFNETILPIVIKIQEFKRPNQFYKTRYEGLKLKKEMKEKREEIRLEFTGVINEIVGDNCLALQTILSPAFYKNL